MILWYGEEYSFLCVFKFVYLKKFNQNTHRDSVIFSVSKKAPLSNIVPVIAREGPINSTPNKRIRAFENNDRLSPWGIIETRQQYPAQQIDNNRKEAISPEAKSHLARSMSWTLNITIF